MKKGLKITLYVIGGLVVLGAIGNAINPKEGAETVVASENTESVAVVNQDSINRAEKKAIANNTVKSVDLVAHYVANEVKADADLKGRELYVSAKVGAISKDITNSIYVTLESNDPVRSVQCFIDDENAVGALQKGQKVLVKGTCKGLMMNVLMKDCTLVPQ